MGGVGVPGDDSDISVIRGEGDHALVCEFASKISGEYTQNDVEAHCSTLDRDYRRETTDDHDNRPHYRLMVSKHQLYASQRNDCTGKEY